jgi:NAD(P)H-dependent FMN reductase/ketosteroid isomerase-like protein
MLVSGSLREGSVNGAVVRTAADRSPDGVRAEIYPGLGRLPPFNPDDDREGAQLDSAVAELRRELADTDAILFCTPEYAGTLPGSFKNLLDWTVGGGETYGMPVAWINASGPAAPAGGAGAHAALRSVLTYTGAVIVEEACRRVPITRDQIGEDGLITGPAADEIAEAVAELGRAATEDRASVPVAEAVLAADQRFFDALRCGDAAALEALLAEDFVIVEVGSGGVHTREAFVTALGNGLIRFVAIETEPGDALVRVHGALAIVVGKTAMTIAGPDGTPATVHSRYTHVFDTDGGSWRLLSAQGTVLADPA